MALDIPRPVPTARLSGTASTPTPPSMPKSVDEQRQLAQKVAKAPKPRKVERRRRGRNS